MKKFTLLLALIFTTISFAQTISSKQEDANVEQYALLTKVNQYYPDITLSKTITNFYADGKIIDSQQQFVYRSHGVWHERWRLGGGS